MVIMEIVQIVPDEIPECARRPKSSGLLKLTQYVRADSMIVNFSKIQKRDVLGNVSTNFLYILRDSNPGPID